MSDPFKNVEMSESEDENEMDGTELIIIDSDCASERLALSSLPPTFSRSHLLTQTSQASGQTSNFGFAHPPIGVPQPSNPGPSSSTLSASSEESLQQSSGSHATTR